MSAHQITGKLENVKLLLLDVDGVLTDGSIIYNDDSVETKSFNVKDGLGIRLAIDAGIKVGIVTGRSSGALRTRCRDLGIEYIYDGVKDKGAILDQILDRTDVRAHEVAFVGDDLPDLCLMKKVGVSIAVADAHKIVAKHADMVTKAKGGAGAVREVCEAILNSKGVWEKILDLRFLPLSL